VNIPNLITLSRLVITAGVFVCLELAPEPRLPLKSPTPTLEGLAHANETLVWIAFVLFLVAAVTDFKLVPPRLTPGFEHRLSRGSGTVTYLAFGVGLALSGLWLEARRRRKA